MTQVDPDRLSQIRSSSIEELYAVIGNGISGAIAEEWVEAWYAFEQEEADANFTYGQYVDVRPFDDAYDIEMDLETAAYVSEAFEALRADVAERGEEPWTRAVFTLYPEGRFNIEYDYGPLEGAGWRRVEALIEAKRES